MSNNQYSLFPASIVSGGPTTTSFQQLGSADCDPGNSFGEIICAGALDRAANVLNFADPKVRIGTADLAKVFGIISPTGGLSCTGGATFRYQQRSNFGTFSGSTTNTTVTSTLGFIYPESLSAQQDRPAMCELHYCAHYDGSTAALVSTGSVSFAAAPQPAFNALYYLGPVYVNSAQIEALTSVKIDFGISYKSERLDGDVISRKGYIMQRKPRITFSFLRANLAPSAPLTSWFGNAAAGEVDCYFPIGLPNGGGRDAYTNATHFKISSATGTFDPKSLSAADEGDATFSITYLPTDELGLSLTSTIP